MSTDSDIYICEIELWHCMAFTGCKESGSKKSLKRNTFEIYGMVSPA